MVCAAADLLIGEEAEPPLHLVDPRRVGRDEVQVEPGVFGFASVVEQGNWALGGWWRIATSRPLAITVLPAATVSEKS